MNKLLFQLYVVILLDNLLNYILHMYFLWLILYILINPMLYPNLISISNIDLSYQQEALLTRDSFHNYQIFLIYKIENYFHLLILKQVEWLNYQQVHYIHSQHLNIQQFCIGHSKLYKIEDVRHKDILLLVGYLYLKYTDRIDMYYHFSIRCCHNSMSNQQFVGLIILNQFLIQQTFLLIQLKQLKKHKMLDNFLDFSLDLQHQNLPNQHQLQFESSRNPFIKYSQNRSDEFRINIFTQILMKQWMRIDQVHICKVNLNVNYENEQFTNCFQIY